MVAATYTPAEDYYYLNHATGDRKWQRIHQSIKKMTGKERRARFGRDHLPTISAIRNRVQRIISGKQMIKEGKCKNRCKICGQFARGHTCLGRSSATIQYKQVHLRFRFQNATNSDIHDLQSSFQHNLCVDKEVETDGEETEEECEDKPEEYEDRSAEEYEDKPAEEDTMLFFSWLDQQEQTIHLDPIYLEPNLQDLEDYIMTSTQWKDSEAFPDFESLDFDDHRTQTD